MATNPLVLLDINVVLELLLNREKYKVVEQYLLQNTDKKLCISASSLPTIWYFCEDLVDQKNQIITFLNALVLLDTTSKEIELAYELWSGKEFEDALQVATAVSYDCQIFVTFDNECSKLYKDQIKIILLG